jgi:hypothetical protein
VAIGTRAEVYVLDGNIKRLRKREFLLNNRASTVSWSTLAVEQLVPGRPRHRRRPHRRHRGSSRASTARS